MLFSFIFVYCDFEGFSFGGKFFCGFFSVVIFVWFGRGRFCLFWVGLFVGLVPLLAADCYFWCMVFKTL